MAQKPLHPEGFWLLALGSGFGWLAFQAFGWMLPRFYVWAGFGLGFLQIFCFWLPIY